MYYTITQFFRCHQSELAQNTKGSRFGAKSTLYVHLYEFRTIMYDTLLYIKYLVLP